MASRSSVNTRVWACPSTGRTRRYLLVECAGHAGSAGLLVDELAGVLGECPQVQATAVAVDAASRERLWAYRERHTEAINAAGIPHKLDVTLPFDQLVDFERAVRAALTRWHPVRVWCASGTSATATSTSTSWARRQTISRLTTPCWAWSRRWEAASARSTASVSPNAPALGTLAGQPIIAAMRAIKLALDPRRILNPGVLVAP